jgi:hypothetical protein
LPSGLRNWKEKLIPSKKEPTPIYFPERNINLQALSWLSMGMKALLGHLLVERLQASYFNSLKYPCHRNTGKR